MNLQWVTVLPFALTLGLVLFAAYVAFFTEPERPGKKKPASR